MPAPDTPPHFILLRRPLVFLACGLTAGWLQALFFFPAEWQDRHGYNNLAVLYLLGLLHGILGLSLWVMAAARVVRFRFALLVLFAPVAQQAGSGIDLPRGYVLLVLPSVAILIAGYFEVCGRPASDTEPFEDTR